MVEGVKWLCYMGYLLESEDGVERAVEIRVSGAWYKWRDVWSQLKNRSEPLKNRNRVFNASNRSVLPYGSEE